MNLGSSTSTRCFEHVMKVDPAAQDHEELERSLQTTWNARIVQYDPRECDFTAWVRRRMESMGYSVPDLGELHRIIPEAETHAVSQQLCADTARPDFRRLLFRLANRVIVPEGRLRRPVAIQRLPNIRFFLPNRPAGTFPFHTGILYGHGPASRSVWMPLTDVSSESMRSASMQIIDVNRSRELVEQAREDAWSIQQMNERFGRECTQCKAGPGQLVLFGQENLHGNFVNRTGKTRVSIDFRLAEGCYGHMLARKIPAGYFHFLPTEGSVSEAAPREPGRGLTADRGRTVSYVSNNTPALFATPAHLQRIMMQAYCARRGIVSEFEFFELEGMPHLPTLRHLIEDVGTSVVLYSIFALPEDKDDRSDLLRSSIRNGVTLTFANEELEVSRQEELHDVEAYLEFARYGDSHTPVGLPVVR